jgi:hypothetical protein
MISDSALKTLIRARAIAKRNREFEQRQLLPENDDFHETIRGKLQGLCETPQFENFSRCGNEDIFRTCKSCGQVEKFKYRCCIKWCPRCQWRITHTRQNLIEFWASKISQPKHLVLTQKNFPILSHDRITDHTGNLAAMRRRKSFEDVRGGCVSVEITNEGTGWHLHSHWLLDVDWLEMSEVSKDWGALVGQTFAVCKVMDCRDRSYIQEISKYVVEGSELAKWPSEQVNEFVLAVRGLRFFFSFGTLFKLGPAIRAELATQDGPPTECSCGEEDFVYETEQDVVLHEIRELARRKRR